MSYINYDQIEEIIKKSPATTFLFILLVATFAGCYIWGDGASDLDTARLFGAITPYDATTDGLIRTITSTFQQIGGPVHLLLNLSAIAVTGPFLEKIYGPIKYTFFFLITGIFGGLFTLMFSDLNVISAGASGSGYGLMGLYLGLIIKRDPLIDKVTKNWVLNLIWMNIIYTFTTPNISISGHMGGIISGTILAWLFSTYNYKCKWFLDFIKSIITFIIVVICIQIPNIIWPNTNLPYIQEIREKFGLETIYEGSNDFNNELIYNFLETSNSQSQPTTIIVKLSHFISANIFELIISIFIFIVSWKIGRRIVISRTIKKLIKNNSYYSIAQQNRSDFLLNKLGYDVVENYSKTHPKTSRKKIMKKQNLKCNYCLVLGFKKFVMYCLNSFKLLP